MTASPGPVLVFQGGMPAFVDPLTLSTQTPAGLASMSAALSAAHADIVGLTQRVAALEGKPDPCVALSGALPLATLQVGTIDVMVPVPGLLSTDRIAVEVMADIPAGLSLGSMRPSPTAIGILIVQVTAVSLQPNKAALPLTVTALR